MENEEQNEEEYYVEDMIIDCFISIFSSLDLMILDQSQRYKDADMDIDIIRQNLLGTLGMTIKEEYIPLFIQSLTEYQKAVNNAVAESEIEEAKKNIFKSINWN